MLTILLVLLGCGSASVLVRMMLDFIKNREKDYPVKKFWLAAGGSSVINIFEVLGIGNMAPLTILIKYGKLLDDDRKFPGTLNLCCSLPIFLEGFLYMNSIEVDVITLVVNIVGCVIGGLVGPHIVKKCKARPIRIVIGFALVIAATFMLLGRLNLMPTGGEATALTGGKLAISFVGQFLIGILGSFGIGCFSLCMCLIYFLGMSAAVSFPIMMGAAAFLQVANNNVYLSMSAKATRAGEPPMHNRTVAVAVAVFGVIGICIGYFIIKSLSVTALQWLVLCIVYFAGIMLLVQNLKKPADEISA